MDRPLSTRSIADGSQFTSSLSGSLPRGDTGISMVTAPKHPEPYLSIPAQALVQDNCRVNAGMVRKENKYKKWQDRYLVLHKGCLYYYKDSTDKKAQGQFSLSGYRLSNAPERSKYTWTFKFTHIQPEKRTYYFAAHSEKERIEWFDKIQQDLHEYCDPRPTYNIGTGAGTCDSGSSSSGSSYASSEENDINYDYPEVEVSPRSIESMKQKFLQHSITTVIPGNPSADYCPPPEFLPTDTAIKKGKLPPTLPNKPFSQARSTSVDVSKILRPDLSSTSGAVGPNKAAVDIVQVLNRSLKQRNQSTTPKPAIPRRIPIQSENVMSVSPHLSSSLSSSPDTAEEMYLELSNDPTDPPGEPLPSQSTLLRMRPDGNSFKTKYNESPLQDVLPPSAYRLDYNKIDAIPLLLGYEGAYMIHSSTRGDIKQSLSVCAEEKIKHYLIFCNEDGYALDPKGLRFPSVEDMLRHFHEKPLPNQNRATLRTPYK